MLELMIPSTARRPECTQGNPGFDSWSGPFFSYPTDDLLQFVMGATRGSEVSSELNAMLQAAQRQPSLYPPSASQSRFDTR